MSLISFLRRKSALLHLVWGWKGETFKTPVQLERKKKSPNLMSLVVGGWEQTRLLSPREAPTTPGDVLRGRGERGAAGFHCFGVGRDVGLILQQVGREERWERRGERQQAPGSEMGLGRGRRCFS